MNNLQKQAWDFASRNTAWRGWHAVRERMPIALFTPPASHIAGLILSLI
jgi:hypothetical protein